MKALDQNFGILPNLTRYEHKAIQHTYNLADGHAHQPQTRSQEEIVTQLPAIFRKAEASSQIAIEEGFRNAFYELAGQPTAQRMKSFLLSYSASMSIEIAANFLKRKTLRTGLIEPTFDNLSSILRRIGVEVEAIDEAHLLPVPDVEYLSKLDLKALFLVLPNNPSGVSISAQSFLTLVEFCKSSDILLIIDFSFRFFETSLLWDQYELAFRSHIKFIFIEDTGKTWPTLDQKASIMGSDQETFGELFSIHNDFLLNVSPFTLELLRFYILDTIQTGIQSSVFDLLESNRAYLRSALSKLPFSIPNSNSKISVEWIKSESPSQLLWMELQKRGVFILPGHYFYWNGPERGSEFLRIALMRDGKMFRRAVTILTKTFAALDLSSL